MNKVIDFKIIEQFKIQLRFQDGETKIVDFKPLIGIGICELLFDTSFFKKVSIDNGGGLER